MQKGKICARWWLPLMRCDLEISRSHSSNTYTYSRSALNPSQRDSRVNTPPCLVPSLNESTLIHPRYHLGPAAGRRRSRTPTANTNLHRTAKTSYNPLAIGKPRYDWYRPALTFASPSSALGDWGMQQLGSIWLRKYWSVCGLSDKKGWAVESIALVRAVSSRC